MSSQKDDPARYLIAPLRHGFVALKVDYVCPEVEPGNELSVCEEVNPRLAGMDGLVVTGIEGEPFAEPNAC